MPYSIEDIQKLIANAQANQDKDDSTQPFTQLPMQVYGTQDLNPSAPPTDFLKQIGMKAAQEIDDNAPSRNPNAPDAVNQDYNDPVTIAGSYGAGRLAPQVAERFALIKKLMRK